MTKIHATEGEKKPVEVNVTQPAQLPPAPAYTAVQMNSLPSTSGFAKPKSCYVLSILATIFCWFLPCGFIGLVHSVSSEHEYKQGDINASRRKAYSAKCWTAWGIALGAVVLILLTTGTVMYWKCAERRTFGNDGVYAPSSTPRTWFRGQHHGMWNGEPDRADYMEGLDALRNLLQ